jgi:hypothetical protein
MTVNQFRKLALELPEAEESAHMDHPDFRLRGKIFATLGYPDGAWGMVKLTPQQQRVFVHEQPKVFQPVKGGWGARGATNVCLKVATVTALRPALETAWQNVAPKRLLQASEK